MNKLRTIVDKIKPTFSEGGKVAWLHSTFDAFETFLFVPNTTTRLGSHVRDCVDLKRLLIIVVMSLVPAFCFGTWNIGAQHAAAIGETWTFWHMVGYGLLKIIPLYLVSYIVGLGIEFASAQIKGHEVSEGYLVSGFIIPLIVPVEIPLWQLALAVAFAVVFGKEVFGGTGMNIWNPALLARAFLFFSYPKQMSGETPWVADAVSGATPLAYHNVADLSSHYSAMDMFIGTVPGSVGETSVIAILIGAAILVCTGIASWKIMVSSVAGALLVGWLGETLSPEISIPCWYHLIMGGFAFGTVFMATDPVTAAQTECGKWIYGFLVGALCVTVRLFNPGYPEGMMLAILFGNTMAPVIDHCVVSVSLKRYSKKVA